MIAIIVSKKVDLREKKIPRDKEGHFKKLRGEIIKGT